MIEQIIYFALGCVVTALAALAFAPLFWHRALRLTRARLQSQVPLSMQEILAERDQLRAEFAVKHLELEQSMEKVRGSKTRDMAVIGRQSLAATKMADEIVALRNLDQSQEQEIRRLMEDLAGAESEAAAIRLELHDSAGLVERWRGQSDRDAEARSAMRAELDDKHTLAASLESRVAGLETRLADAQHAGEAREHGLRGRLEAAMANSARHETSAVALRHEVDEARQRVRRLELEVAAAADEARERRQRVDLEQSLRNGKARGSERSSAGTIEELRADNEELLERLAPLQHLGAAAGPEPTASDDAGLRASIHALGLAVSRMTSRSPLEEAQEERERRDAGSTPPSDAA